MKKLIHPAKFWTLLFLMIISLTRDTFGQCVTTSSFSGVVLDEEGTSLIGVNIIALHLPSGTIYGTSSHIEGNFRIPNMRVGGPYRITASYTGYGENTIEDITLSLEKLRGVRSFWKSRHWNCPALRSSQVQERPVKMRALPLRSL